ncbi:MAG: hypothetical protein MR889_08175, partial [Clostridiales bacterium]|nr:hypothetical protein [Clostridiales bacterium]
EPLFVEFVGERRVEELEFGEHFLDFGVGVLEGFVGADEAVVTEGFYRCLFKVYTGLQVYHVSHFLFNIISSYYEPRTNIS